MDTVRKDPAVHVSLSSDSLVKQPGTGMAPLSRRWERSKFLASDRNRTPGPRMKRVSVEGASQARSNTEANRAP